ncbi:uncharacterized protein LOC112044566 [Bicyclus anynana]|uniref:Uncharacterized protein LOC112044566 n=1 Tax=Bicyclus anynana TaxID=110368 RepID=A0ABM3M8P9_BICAN|nr:uncharacterized protein LOC112044566 [Bicyclus anynana]
MKSVVLLCLLVIAGGYALPTSEIVPTQDRIVDYWLIDAIETLTQWIKANGYDPFEFGQNFNWIFFDDTLEIVGYVSRLRFTGASNINIDNLYYNILLGRLDVDFVIPQLFLQIGHYKGQIIQHGVVIYDLEISGSLAINDVRIKGDVLLRLSGGSVQIHNINPQFSIGSIQADPTVIESGRDVSLLVRYFLHVTVPNFLETYKNEINTIIGEQIRQAVNRWW